MTVVLPGDGQTTEIVSLVKPGELEGQEIVDAEFVDEQAPAAADWMAERRARMAAAPAIVPRWLKDRGEFIDASSFVARYYARQAGFYALRTPVYAGRLWLRAPVGAGRATQAWWEWIRDADFRPMVKHAAGTNDQAAMTLSEKVQDRTAERLRQSAIVAVPAGLLIYLGYILLPPAVIGLFTAGVLSLLGLAGRNSDRPIIRRYVAVKLQRRLDSGEIEGALEAIGVKGRPDFVNPIQTDGPGWLAEFDLPGATLAQFLMEKRPQLAAAMRRPLSCVWPEGDRDAHPGRVRLWVAREDPAKAKRRLWPLMKSGQANLFEPIPFGFDPRGRLVPLELMGANMLIGGVMGSGKTSATLALALAGALDPTTELHIYEMKGSGDLVCVQPVSRVYMSGDDPEHCEQALNGLRWLEREMKRRKDIIQGLPLSDVPDGRKVSPQLAARRELGLHPILAIFDEVHTLFENDEYGDAAKKAAADLIRKARAYGIIIIFTTQRPDKDSIPKKVSDNAILRFCLAVNGQQSNDMVLGTSMYKSGIRSTIFDPRQDAGTGYLATCAADARIVRAAFIKQEEAAAIGRRAYALRLAAGTLPDQQPEIEVGDDTTLLDHLRAVWPAGEETMHSHKLVEALAAYRPGEYGAWMATDPPESEMDEAALRELRTRRSTMLATAVQPYGLSTRQINKRGQGGSAKGLRFEDLQNADSEPKQLEPA